jgi:hypothetical protein
MAVDSAMSSRDGANSPGGKGIGSVYMGFLFTRTSPAPARAGDLRRIVAIDTSRVDRKTRVMIGYRIGQDIDLDALIDVYRDSTLGERRPVDDRERMRQMLERANLVVSAWHGERLIGIARSLSDFCYATYLSDIAVRLAY